MAAAAQRVGVALSADPPRPAQPRAATPFPCGPLCVTWVIPSEKRAVCRKGTPRRVARPAPVVFVGASTFTYWHALAEDWAPHPVANVAFGRGSCVAFGGSCVAQVEH